MSIYIKGQPIENAQTYTLYSVNGDVYTQVGSPQTELNFNISALGLSAGDYKFAVRASAEGYQVSNYSNIITVTITEEKETYTITYKYMFGTTQLRVPSYETVTEDTVKYFSIDDAPTFDGYVISDLIVNGTPVSGPITINGDIEVVYQYEQPATAMGVEYMINSKINAASGFADWPTQGQSGGIAIVTFIPCTSTSPVVTTSYSGASVIVQKYDSSYQPTSSSPAYIRLTIYLQSSTIDANQDGATISVDGTTYKLDNSVKYILSSRFNASTGVLETNNSYIAIDKMFYNFGGRLSINIGGMLGAPVYYDENLNVTTDTLAPFVKFSFVVAASKQNEDTLNGAIISGGGLRYTLLNS